MATSLPLLPSAAHIRPSHFTALKMFCDETGADFQNEIDEALEAHIACSLPARLRRSRESRVSRKKKLVSIARHF